MWDVLQFVAFWAVVIGLAVLRRKAPRSRRREPGVSLGRGPGWRRRNATSLPPRRISAVLIVRGFREHYEVAYGLRVTNLGPQVARDVYLSVEEGAEDQILLRRELAERLPIRELGVGGGVTFYGIQNDTTAPVWMVRCRWTDATGSHDECHPFHRGRPGWVSFGNDGYRPE